MTVLDAALGEHAGAFLLVSSLLVMTLATIAAIVDIALRGLEDAGLPAVRGQRPLVHPMIFAVIGLPATVIVFVGGTVQAYAASASAHAGGAGAVLFTTINVSIVIAVLVWALASPLARHWGLALGGFGLCLALIFPLLALVLQLPFLPFGELASKPDRVLFGLTVAGILCCVGGCTTSLLAMLVYVIRSCACLVDQHRLHAGGGMASASRHVARPRRLRLLGASTPLTPPPEPLEPGSLRSRMP